jgi:hypothetical protein
MKSIDDTISDEALAKAEELLQEARDKGAPELSTLPTQDEVVRHRLGGGQS